MPFLELRGHRKRRRARGQRQTDGLTHTDGFHGPESGRPQASRPTAFPVVSLEKNISVPIAYVPPGWVSVTYNLRSPDDTEDTDFPRLKDDKRHPWGPQLGGHPSSTVADARLALLPSLWPPLAWAVGHRRPAGRGHRGGLA